MKNPVPVADGLESTTSLPVIIELGLGAMRGLNSRANCCALDICSAVNRLSRMERDFWPFQRVHLQVQNFELNQDSSICRPPYNSLARHRHWRSKHQARIEPRGILVRRLFDTTSQLQSCPLGQYRLHRFAPNDVAPLEL